MSMNSNAEAVKPAAPAQDAALRQVMRPVLELLQQPDVTEIAINRPQEVWERRFGGWTPRTVEALTRAQLTAITTAMVSYNRIGDGPRLSLRLPDGERVELLKAPAVVSGIAITIRKHTPVVKTLTDLAEGGSFDDVDNFGADRINKLTDVEERLLELRDRGETVRFLSEAVKAKLNIVVSGKTGSGKTTFARSLIEEVPNYERLITIEDTHELYLDNHPNRVHLLFGHGQGRISASEALMSCYRLSPDRIFLAEMRKDEAWEYLTSLNTGHPGAISTVHANSADSTFDRIADLVQQSPVGSTMQRQMIMSVLYKTIDVVLYYSERKLMEVYYDPMFAKKEGDTNATHH